MVLLVGQPPNPHSAMQPSHYQAAHYQNNIAIGGSFSLRNQHNQRVSDTDFAGRYMLLYFGFTYCPDVCPTGLQIMAQALDELEKTAPQKAAIIAPIFVSVDPQRDTPAALADYMPLFHPRLTGLTGTQAEIDSIMRAYKIYAAKVPDSSSAAAYTIDHSSFFYLMSPDGKFIRHFDHLISPEKMAATLNKIIDN